MRSELKVALATATFALVHSALANDRVKEAIGSRVPHGRELYRFLFNGQSLITFGALALYISRQPKRTIYRIDGAAAGVMRLAQVGGIGFAVAAAAATGAVKLTGIDNLLAVVQRKPPRPVPVAQGPELDDSTGELAIRGPFRISRHPLNLAPLLPFWMTPHMTTRRLALNLVASAYFVLGSLHEEHRLRRAYGETYERYTSSGVPFYAPALRPRVAAAPKNLS